jgi:predicted DNA-binding transcriptional regulator AlpA
VSVPGAGLTPKDALEAVRAAAQEAATTGQLPDFLAELERIRVEAILAATAVRKAAPAPRPAGRVLTVQEAAQRLGRSRWWVYRHKATLPVTRFQTGGFGFDEKALERWIAGRTR